ncbi:hypothetical protein SDC9_195545 [bioreactor metagenome]|uniref:Uncharacterized protein n=1 Tax=bioreactor metagenome TaxID=1076179 RepID=A0A645I9D4_9ZZZZ
MIRIMAGIIKPAVCGARTMTKRQMAVMAIHSRMVLAGDLIFVARAPMIGDEKSEVPYIRILPISAAIATLAPNTACT